MIIHEYLPIIYSIACLGLIGFQIALILGAPWGPITQGGKHPGKLPVSGRIAAGVSIVILLAMASAINSAAGGWPHWPFWTGWAALAIQATSTLANWITPSQPERKLWGPITLTMLILAASVMFIPSA